MVTLNGKGFAQVSAEVLGKRVRMKSDCEFFPGFDVTGKVVAVNPGPNGETVMTVIASNGKTIYVGSNMKNLRYDKC